MDNHDEGEIQQTADQPLFTAEQLAYLQAHFQPPQMGTSTRGNKDHPEQRIQDRSPIGRDPPQLEPTPG